MEADFMNDFARIQDSDLLLEHYHCIEKFPECGGVAIFIGTVRNHHQGKEVKGLTYTAYAPLAEKMIRAIEEEVQAKFQVAHVRVVHRVGALDIGGTAIIALAYSAHRHEAFMACEEAVERVKHEVPVYKEEFYLDGSSKFIEGCCIRHDREPVASTLAHSHQHTSSHHHSDHCSSEHIHKNDPHNS